MLLRTWRFITLMLTSLSMAMAFCHLLQMPPRMNYDSALWLTTTQSLFQYFGTVGAFIEGGAWISAILLALFVRKHKPAFRLTAIGAGCLLAAHVAFWWFIFPINAEIGRWTLDTIPANWTRIRSQWEYTHATRAILQILGLASLLLSVLAETNIRPVAEKKPIDRTPSQPLEALHR